MYFAVFLIDSEINLLVPAKWIFFLNVNDIVNNGIFTTEEHLIFFSENVDKTPDFFSPVRRHFIRNVDACYHANIVKVFGTYKSLVLFISKFFLLKTNFLFLDDNDVIAQHFIYRRRCFKPVFYSDPIKRLLSYRHEPRPLPPIDTPKQNEMRLLQKTFSLLEKKLHEAAFDENEKRAIQRIVIDGYDDDDEYVPMEIIYPIPIKDIKTEASSSTSEAISSSPLTKTVAVDYVTNRKIPFQTNVSIHLILVENHILV